VTCRREREQRPCELAKKKKEEKRKRGAEAGKGEEKRCFFPHGREELLLAASGSTWPDKSRKSWTLTREQRKESDLATKHLAKSLTGQGHKRETRKEDKKKKGCQALLKRNKDSNRELNQYDLRRLSVTPTPTEEKAADRR